MRILILIFIANLFSLQSIAQVGIEVEGKVLINNLDTVLSPSQMTKLVRKENGHLAIKSSANPIIFIEKPNPLPYTSDFIDFDSSYEGGYYYKHNKRVFLGGLIRKSNFVDVAINDTIAILPKGYRPIKRLIVSGIQESTIVRMNIETDGVIRVLSSGAPMIKYIGLSGISFPLTHEIGDEVGGGYLFYLCDPPEDLNGDGILDLGLVAAPVDQSASNWGCQGTTINTIDGLGSGIENTDSIIINCIEPDIAAKICFDLDLNGFSDWYLPSKAETELMWENLADSDGDGINLGISDPHNIGQFENSNYITSLNYTALSCWARNFSSGVQGTIGKNNLLFVRAIRILQLE